MSYEITNEIQEALDVCPELDRYLFALNRKLYNTITDSGQYPDLWWLNNNHRAALALLSRPLDTVKDIEFYVGEILVSINGLESLSASFTEALTEHQYDWVFKTLNFSIGQLRALYVMFLGLLSLEQFDERYQGV